MKKFTSTECWSRKDSLTKLTTPWAIPGISRHPLKSTHTRQSDFQGEITAGFVFSAMEPSPGKFPIPQGHACGVCYHSCCVTVLDIFSRQWYWVILLWDTNTTYCVTWCYTHVRWFNCVTHAAGRYWSHLRWNLLVKPYWGFVLFVKVKTCHTGIKQGKTALWPFVTSGVIQCLTGWLRKRLGRYRIKLLHGTVSATLNSSPFSKREGNWTEFTFAKTSGIVTRDREKIDQ